MPGGNPMLQHTLKIQEEIKFCSCNSADIHSPCINALSHTASAWNTPAMRHGYHPCAPASLRRSDFSRPCRPYCRPRSRRSAVRQSLRRPINQHGRTHHGLGDRHQVHGVASQVCNACVTEFLLRRPYRLMYWYSIEHAFLDGHH